MALRVQGIATPEGADFTVYNPAPQGLKLPALRAEVAEPGRLRPRLFLLLFFHTGPAPSSKPAASPNLPRKPLLGQLPYEVLIVATQRLTEANTGELLALPFSLYSVLIFDRPGLCF